MILEDLTHSELLVMKSVWDMEEEVPLSEILAYVNTHFDKDWKPQTVSTFLAKLVKKNYLQLVRRGKNWVYQILVSDEEYRNRQMVEYMNFWGGNKVGLTLSALFKDHSLKQEEIRELRRLLDGLDDDTVL